MTNMSEDTSERALRYIATLEKALQHDSPLKESKMVGEDSIMKVTDAIQRYLQDARYYINNGKPTTSLASIAYAEGLLDALKFLNLTKTIASETQ